MIVYNNRFKGPFEYEKFILNILSFHNIVNEIDICENENINQELKTITYLNNEVEKLFNNFCNNGYSEKIYVLTSSKIGVSKYDS